MIWIWWVARPSNSNLNKNDLDLRYRSIGKRSETLFLVFMNGRLVTSILGINHCWVLPGNFYVFYLESFVLAAKIFYLVRDQAILANFDIPVNMFTSANGSWEVKDP